VGQKVKKITENMTQNCRVFEKCNAGFSSISFLAFLGVSRPCKGGSKTPIVYFILQKVPAGKTIAKVQCLFVFKKCIAFLGVSRQGETKTHKNNCHFFAIFLTF
jgi:hypothetical protein